MNAFTINTMLAEENTRIYDDFMCNRVCTSWEEWQMLDAKKAEERAFWEEEAREEARIERQLSKYLQYLEQAMHSANSMQVELGHYLYSVGHDMWYSLPAEVKQGIYYIFDDAVLPYYIIEVHKLTGASLEDISRGWTAVSAYDAYSDVYKDLYGVRPRWVRLGD